MKKERIVIIILSVLLAVESIAWFLSSQPKEKSWIQVERWTGSQTDYNMTTKMFLISGAEEWRVGWGSSGQSADSHFRIIVYNGYTDSIVKEIEPLPYLMGGSMSGESYLNSTGRFYLKIFILGDLYTWWVDIAEYK
jgi:hypothetical protein